MKKNLSYLIFLLLMTTSLLQSEEEDPFHALSFDRQESVIHFFQQNSSDPPLSSQDAASIFNNLEKEDQNKILDLITSSSGEDLNQENSRLSLEGNPLDSKSLQQDDNQEEKANTSQSNEENGISSSTEGIGLFILSTIIVVGLFPEVGILEAAQALSPLLAVGLGPVLHYLFF